MKTRRNSLILSAVMAAVCVLLCLIPDTRLNPYSAIPRAQVRIDAVVTPRAPRFARPA